MQLLEDRCDTSVKLSVVAIVSGVTASLSLLGSGSVATCSAYHRRVCYPEIFPTFHLALADLLASAVLIASSIIFLSEHPTKPPGCHGHCDYVMAAVTSFYTTAFFLTVTYALEAYFRFHRRLKESMNLERASDVSVSSRWMYLIYSVAWLFPLILNFSVMASGIPDSEDCDTLICKTECSACFPDFRFDNTTCWENSAKHKVIKIFFLVPLVTVMFSNLVLYVLIRKVYRQVVMRRGLLSYHQRQEESLLRRKTFLYQSVFIICWLPSIIAGIASFTDNFSVNDMYPLFVIQAILAPLQGLFNSIVYGWKRDSFRRALTERSSLLSSTRSSTMSVTL